MNTSENTRTKVKSVVFYIIRPRAFSTISLRLQRAGWGGLRPPLPDPLLLRFMRGFAPKLL